MKDRGRNRPYAFIPPLARAKRGGAVQHVQDLVRDAIVQLALPPGSFIDKVALCARLGVSRFPVSEALGRLADEGFVEILPQRGTMVARIRLQDVHEAMFIRCALECEMVHTLAARTDRSYLAALERNIREQERALAQNEHDRFQTLDIEFHNHLLGTLGLERLKSLVVASRASLDRMHRFLCTTHRKAQTLDEHKAILAGLRSADPLAAAQAMRAHLDAVMAELMDFAKNHPETIAAGQSGDTAAA